MGGGGVKEGQNQTVGTLLQILALMIDSGFICACRVVRANPWKGTAQCLYYGKHSSCLLSSELFLDHRGKLQLIYTLLLRHQNHAISAAEAG